MSAEVKSTEEKSFEEKLADVKRMIDGIESGRLPLEEAVRQYEAGLRALNAMEKELEDMKRRISVIHENADGMLVEEPMSVEQTNV